MRTINYRESLARYGEVLDCLVNDHEEVVVTRAGHEPVVTVSLEDTSRCARRPTSWPRPPTLAACSMPWRLLVWDENAWQEFPRWQAQDRRTLTRIDVLHADVARNGNEGIGKPEALKRDVAGYWSRRITNEHRLVGEIWGAEIRVAACRYHYG